MTDDYRLEIDGDEYRPVPESWLEHPSAVDHDEGAPAEAVRLYATSVAVVADGTRLRVRYTHPRSPDVLTRSMAATEGQYASERVPRAFERDGLVWAKTYVPGRFDEPDGTIRRPERDHFIDLWRDRLIGGGAGGITIADGGSSTGESVQLPRQEWERVLMGLVMYANTEKSRKDNPEKARSIRTTAREIARQLNTGSSQDGGGR